MHLGTNSFVGGKIHQMAKQKNKVDDMYVVKKWEKKKKIAKS